MAALVWLREGDEDVWHHLVRRISSGRWQTACGWEMSAMHGQLWPQKAGEVGPLAAERCNDCVAGVTTPADEGRDVDNLAACH
jgi:hypothetical protein